MFHNLSAGSVLWDLNDLQLTLAYGHEIARSITGQFQVDNADSDSVLARAGMILNPKVTAGFEAANSYTRYQESALNDYDTLSLGVYSEWNPSSALKVNARAGYVAYFIQDTSSTPANDINSYYLSAGVLHQITDTINYSVDAGREYAGGVLTPFVQSWYVRSTVSCNAIKDLGISADCSYEHGKQGPGTPASGSFGNEVFDYIVAGFAVSYQITKRLEGSLTGRFTARTSSVSSNEYLQNVVGLQLTYKML